MIKNKRLIIFANTLWFLENFKFDLINKLSESANIDCLYIRKGPEIDQKKIILLKKKGVIFKRISLLIFLQIFRETIFRKFNQSNKIDNIIVFTIGPIIISYFLFYPLHKSIIIVIEGLGRIFSSNLIYFKIIKKFVILFYKDFFRKCKYVVTLNYCDSTYLGETGIVEINKIRTIPGTGININQFNFSDYVFEYQPKYIDYVARLVPDKGFYVFLNTFRYLKKYHYDFSIKFPFRIITPRSDIDKISYKDKRFLMNLGIVICPYIVNQMEYYRESKAIILPTKYGEGLSRVAMEAIYLNIPLLTSQNQGIDQLLPYNYKYFLDSFNPSRVAYQLINLLSDDDYVNNIYKNQRKFIEQYYSINSSINAFILLLN